MKNTIINADVFAGLKQLPDESVHCCVTSPPYYALRNYDIEGQLGLEPTPEAYIQRMADVFDEVKRVLRKDGTLWLNIGDSYWGGKGQSGSRDGEFQAERAEKGESINQEYQQMGGKGKTRPQDGRHDVIKPKDLIGIPWMLAFELRKRGFYLRQDIIWHKPNCMPESVTDRCTKSHEYIFLLSKSQKYYFNHIDIQQQANYDGRKDIMMKGSQKYLNGFAPTGQNEQTMSVKGHERWQRKETKSHIFGNRKGELGDIHSGKEWNPQKKMGLEGKGFEGHSGYDNLENPYVANKRSVWTVPTSPFKGSHFATFPEKLIVDCIKAGCPEGGIVLDPFGGAGTTGLVARKLNRNYVMIELNPKYCNMAEKRIDNEMGFFK